MAMFQLICALWGYRHLAHDTPDLARSLERDLAHSADIAPVGPDRSLIALQPGVPDMTVARLTVVVAKL